MVRLKELKQRASSLLENALERLENALPPQGVLPLINPNNYNFTADLNWTSPWDCENNPNSLFCGGSPWQMPLGFDFDLEQDDCTTYLELDTSIFSAKGPQIQISYRNPACIVEQPFPPSITQNLEEEEEEDDDDDQDKPKEPPLIYIPPSPNSGGGSSASKCTNDCGAVFTRYLQEVAQIEAEVNDYQNRRSRETLEFNQSRIFKSPAAPGNGQFYCSQQAEYYWERYLSRRGSEFISPQYWSSATPEKESFKNTSISYLRLIETYKGELESEPIFYSEGSWKRRNSQGYITTVPDCSCLLKRESSFELRVLGRYVTKQCYAIASFPPYGKVFGGADVHLELKKWRVKYQFFTLEDADATPVFASGAPFPEEPPPPPPPPRFKRCKKRCSCVRDNSPALKGILANLLEIKACLQQE
ncbi:MAG: hypothetical protein F6J89_02170 [Symploca sp. SIO1C4]|uniref:Uncharacterized protein n=1 Tax=Symploca sp. SIO1C4 TaxID=2607765 RepID=A0A6B3N4G3_9CYAN|nr:hypothetical protein [Symploca sp. SIO1C4]